MVYTHKFTPKIKQILKTGGVGVIPTDTIYGIVGSALSKQIVERIYTLRKRNRSKPMIILIGKIKDLKLFNITLNRKTITYLNKVWPGKVSVILKCKNKKFLYLCRGKNTLAFRLPKYKPLQNLLHYTGPLVAPSANISGEKPATTIKQAKKYFSDRIDFYVDKGKCASSPSTLILIKNNTIVVERQGAETTAVAKTIVFDAEERRGREETGNEFPPV